MKLKRIGVTGGTGMVGKVLVPELIKAGYEIVLLTRHEERGVRVRTVRGEINDKKAIGKFVEKSDIVLHMAAAVNLDSGDDEYFRKVNVGGTRIILEECKKQKKGLIVTSSIAVFADTGIEEKTESWNLIENPKNRYIKTKKEQLLLLRQDGYKKLVVIFPSVVINPGDYVENKGIGWGWKGWLWEKIGGGVPGGLMATIGNGKRVMNLVSNEDMCNGIIKIIENNKWGEEYILGGFNISAEEYLFRVGRNMNKKTARFRVPSWCLRVMGWGEIIPLNQCFSSKKAETDLGYKISWKI